MMNRKKISDTYLVLLLHDEVSQAGRKLVDLRAKVELDKVSAFSLQLWPLVLKNFHIRVPQFSEEEEASNLEAYRI